MGSLAGIIQGVNAGTAGKMNAATDLSNANMALQAGGSEMNAGAQQAGMREMTGARTIGSQKAGFSASGVNSGAGSALDVLANTALVSKEDQDVIQNNAARAAWGYQAKATQFNNKAVLDKTAGDSQETGDILGGVTSDAEQIVKMVAA